MEITKHQKFKIETISRLKIKNAAYNPRKIDDVSFKNLKKNIKQNGLIETLVWNRTTGNLVSGHQRIKILDSLERKKDYMLTVAVVELGEKEEKEQNIFMNNLSAQGYFDLDMVKDLLPEINYEAAGLLENDLEVLGVEIDLDNTKDDPDAIDSLIADFEEEKKKQKEIKKHKPDLPPVPTDDPSKNSTQSAAEYIKNYNQADKEKKEADTYVTLTFSSPKAKHAFMKKIGHDGSNLYIKGEIFVEKFFKK